MVYIILLNWKGAQDTLACLESLAHLRDVNYKIIVCDNNSPDGSYNTIKAGINSSYAYKNYHLIELDRQQAESNSIQLVKENNSIVLIQTGDNLGFAGGNNVGIRLALNQPDMEYVWLLNNDTEVEEKALYYLVHKCQLDKSIGICGSKIVYFYDREHLQGLGGVYNKWLGTVKHYAGYEHVSTSFDESKVDEEIDYVIGASIFLTRDLIETIGLLSEDYFLYYEELDMAMRSKNKFKQSVSLDSVVYHKEGASINEGSIKSDLSNYYAIKNRLKFSRKYFYPFSFITRFSLFAVLILRLKRGEFIQAKQVLSIILGL